MTPNSTNPYDLVIADLERRRSELDQMIQSMKTFRDAALMIDHANGIETPFATTVSPMFASGAQVGFDIDAIPSDAFFGMTIVEAVIKYLNMVGRKPQSTNEIIEALERGALKGKKYGTIYGVLNRRATTEGDIVNVNGDWGLAEWYGNARKRMVVSGNGITKHFTASELESEGRVMRGPGSEKSDGRIVELKRGLDLDENLPPAADEDEAVPQPLG